MYKPLVISERLRSSAGKFVKMLSSEEDRERDLTRSRLKYQNDRLKIRAEQAEYYKRNQDKIKARSKAYRLTKKGRTVQSEASKKYAKNNRLKHNARSALFVAVKTGKVIKQNCVSCGSPAEAHHPDYSKPLEVIWLCKDHHAEEHRLVRLHARMA